MSSPVELSDFQQDINVIPGEEGNKCCAILVAFSGTSTGRQRRNSFSQTLRIVGEHLVRCGSGKILPGQVTKTVILFTDSWVASDFEEYESMYSIFKSQGVDFIFQMVSSTRSGVNFSEVSVPL
jgi:hypothetical protein